MFEGLGAVRFTIQNMRTKKNEAWKEASVPKDKRYIGATFVYTPYGRIKRKFKVVGKIS